MFDLTTFLEEGHELEISRDSGEITHFVSVALSDEGDKGFVITRGGWRGSECKTWDITEALIVAVAALNGGFREPAFTPWWQPKTGVFDLDLYLRSGQRLEYWVPGYEKLPKGTDGWLFLGFESGTYYVEHGATGIRECDTFSDAEARAREILNSLRAMID